MKSRQARHAHTGLAVRAGTSDVIQQAVKIQPLKAGEEHWNHRGDGYVNLQTPDGGEIREDLTTNYGGLQGVYSLEGQDGKQRIMVLRSTESDHIGNVRALTLYEKTSDMRKYVPQAEFAYQVDGQRAVITACDVQDKTLLGVGVTSTAFEKLEEEAAALGLKEIVFQTDEDGALRFAQNRGYDKVGGATEPLQYEHTLKKILGPGDPKNDMSKFHRFPIVKDDQVIVANIPVNTS